jgi:cystathionine beta-lyase/cystathionine gamma-synthase
MHPSDSDLSVEAILIHFAEENKLHGAVTPPLFQNSLFVFDTTEELVAALTRTPDGPPFVYSRSSNPTLDIVERKIAALEGAESCKATGGGIGAISVALASELQVGAHVVIVESAYGPARGFLEFMKKYGVAHTLVEGSELDEIVGAIRPETTVIYLESPSSMLFRIQDITAVTAIAKEKKITTMIDNTYCTPVYMQPMKYGVDIVLHSASKYLGGHSDINGGAICTDRERMHRMMKSEMNYYSPTMHPFTAWLMMRGLRTLKLRVRQHRENADFIAQWLETRPEVERVNHVSLPSFPQRDRYERFMTGSTGLFSFVPKIQDKAKIYGFCDALKLFARGISWGGFESLVIPAQIREHLQPEPYWLVRLFCGLENAEELKADIEQALVHLA